MSASETVVTINNIEIPGYTIIKELGRGGMATVYLAVQECFGRKVALKIMSPSLASDPNFSARFLRESKIIARLSHPHIIAVYDVGKVGHHHYYAMEYHNGRDLKDKIREGLSVSKALLITKQLALALDYAHNKGYIHRDVKPDNVLFREDGAAVLTDFGIARAANGSQQVTQAGKIVGTPKYMSPEQAKGHSLDARSDLYALGVVFFEMLTGYPPFDGDDPIAVGIKHLKEPPPLLPLELEDFQPIVEKLLAKDPDTRYQTGEQLISDLEEIEFYNQGFVSRAPVDTIGMRTPSTERMTIGQEIAEALAEEEGPITPQHSPVSHKGIGWFGLTSAIVLSAAATAFILRPDLVEGISNHPTTQQLIASADSQLAQLNEYWQQLSAQLLEKSAHWLNTPAQAAVAPAAVAVAQPTVTPIQRATIAPILRDNVAGETAPAPQPEPAAQEQTMALGERPAEPATRTETAVALPEPTAVVGRDLTETPQATSDDSDALTEEIAETTDLWSAEAEPVAEDSPVTTTADRDSDPVDTDVAAGVPATGMPATEEPSPAALRQTEVQQRLAAAQAALAASRLSQPAEDNAIAHFNRVLALAPENNDAITGLRQVSKTYLGLASRNLQDSAFSRARHFLDKAQYAAGQHLTVTLREEIQMLKQQIDDAELAMIQRAAPATVLLTNVRQDASER